MKKFTQILCLLLVSMVVLTACTNNGTKGNSNSSGTKTSQTGTGTGGSGRYVEKDITPPSLGSALIGVFKLDDGKLIAYDADLAHVFESSDQGETWSEKDGPGANSPELKGTRMLSLMDDGTLIAAVTPNQMGTGSDKLMKIAADGTVSALTLTGISTDEPNSILMISHLQALSGNRLYVSHQLHPSEGGLFAKSEGDSDTGKEETGGTITVPEGGELPEGAVMVPNGEETPEGAPEGTDNSESDNETDSFLEGNPSFSSIGGNGKSAVYDLSDGKIIYEFPVEEMVFSMVSDAEKLYSLGFESTINVYGISDFSKKDPIKYTSNGNDMAVLAKSDDYLYIINNKSLSKISADGTTEKVFDTTPFQSSRGYLTQLLQIKDTEFVTLLMDQNGSSLYRYTYDENAKVDPEKSLSIWTLHDNSTIRSAVTQFMQKYPDATIDVQVALEEDSAKTASDAIKSLNTQMLAGDGPDVIVLDGTPVDSYVDKGMLLDLKGKVDTSKMYEKISAPFVSGENIYYLPARFQAAALIGSEQNIKANDTLAKLADSALKGKDSAPLSNNEDAFNALPEGERAFMNFSDVNELFALLWNSSSSEIIQDGALNADKMKELLESMKVISDKYKLEGKNSEDGASMGMAISSSASDTISLFGSTVDFLSQRTLMGGAIINNLMLTSMLTSENTEYASFPGLAKGSWQPVTMVGVSSKTSKEAFSMEFIQALLSDEAQGSLTAGLPVTKKGADAQMRQLNEMAFSAGPDDNMKSSFDIDAFVEYLEVPVLTDATLLDKIQPIAESFCKGQTDLNGAVSQIEQETRNYLAERS